MCLSLGLIHSCVSATEVNTLIKAYRAGEATWQTTKPGSLTRPRLPPELRNIPKGYVEHRTVSRGWLSKSDFCLKRGAVRDGRRQRIVSCYCHTETCLKKSLIWHSAPPFSSSASPSSSGCAWTTHSCSFFCSFYRQHTGTTVASENPRSPEGWEPWGQPRYLPLVHAPQVPEKIHRGPAAPGPAQPAPPAQCPERQRDLRCFLGSVVSFLSQPAGAPRTSPARWTITPRCIAAKGPHDEAPRFLP